MRSSMDATFQLSDQELLDKNAGRRFLDFYGDEGLRIALERYGLFGALRRRGYTDLHLTTHAYDERHTLLIDGDSEGERHRVLELVVRRDLLRIRPEVGAEADESFEVLTTDWLTLRNPIADFQPDRLRMPGQDAPGLGVGERVLELLYLVVDRLSLHAMVTVPEYFHNAVLYARELPFVDPHFEGQLRALRELLMEREGLSLSAASWAMHWGYVLSADDSVLRWRGEAMLRPMHPALRAYVASELYEKEAERERGRLRYRLRRAAFDEQFSREREALLHRTDV